MTPVTKKIAIIIGTRPEMIKLAPIILLLRQGISNELCPIVVFTGQHEDLVQQMADVFGIEPDVRLHVMRANDDLAHLTARLLVNVNEIFLPIAPDLVVVQGDTTTAIAAALAAFYERIPVAHVEAGLRSGDFNRPFPEEANRSLLARLATIHFAPTATARSNLMAEGIARSRIVVTGNTVVDAVELVGNMPPLPVTLQHAAVMGGTEKLILVTMHRRESWKQGIVDVCHSLRTLASARSDIRIAIPVHPGLAVHDQVHGELNNVERIHLLSPLDYRSFLALAARSYLLVTDSGGLQEEGAVLHKPVLVLRDVTERCEAIEAGTARLVGTNPSEIIQSVIDLLDSPTLYRAMSEVPNPFGDGQAAQRIVSSLQNWFERGDPRLPDGNEFTPTRKLPGQLNLEKESLIA